jgi:hypothetical protein
MTLEQAKNLRRTLIEIARRRQRPGSGSSHTFLTRRTAEMKWLDLTPVLTGVTWAVVGAVATRHYMPERVTKDIDVLVATADSKVTRQKLKAAGFTYKGELSIGGSQWISPDGQELDVLEGAESWWSQALQEAQSNRDLQGLPILPLPYLALMKFKASRLQDVADLSRMLGQASQTELDRVRALFKQYLAPDEIEDLESLIALGQLELQPPEDQI